VTDEMQIYAIMLYVIGLSATCRAKNK